MPVSMIKDVVHSLKGSGLAGDFSWFVLNLMVAGGMDEVLI